MKRYSVLYNGTEIGTIEDPDGGYVIYEDHKEEYNDLLGMLHDVIVHTCSYALDGKNVVDSQAIGIYNDAIRLLASHGRIKIVNQYGRRVIAENIKQGKDA